MSELNEYRFTLTRNDSEEETPEGEEAFHWYFTNSAGIGYDVFKASCIENAISIFEEKYDIHISEVNDWLCDDENTYGEISISNSLDGMAVHFVIEKI